MQLGPRPLQEAGSTRGSLAHSPTAASQAPHCTTAPSMLIHKPRVGKLLYLLQLHLPQFSSEMEKQSHRLQAVSSPLKPQVLSCGQLDRLKHPTLNEDGRGSQRGL